jgi:putative sigma-54 modulation protein
MKITYTGVSPDVNPKEKAKLEAKLAKLGKVIERKGEKEVHVVVTKVRHLHKVEMTMNTFDHPIAVAGSDNDLIAAMAEAIDKLEKQVLKVRSKWRDTHRNATDKIQLQEEVVVAPPAPKGKAGKAAKAASAAKPAKSPETKVYRVDHQAGRKPMTLEEAMLEMGSSSDYLVYRDAKTDRICTLLRRTDGHLDLIES